MTFRTTLISIGALIVLLGAVFISDAGIPLADSPGELDEKVEACERDPEGVDEKLNCWYNLIRSELAEHGIDQALEVLAKAYQYETFARMSCHEHAHVVGDTVYYQQYLKYNDLDKIEFPPETAYCGYGFWHGFIEHLIQDHPDPAFVDQTCAYLEERLGGELNDITFTCYHAAGHGFMLDPIDTIEDKAMWGNFRALVARPLEHCESLNTTPRLQEECKVGIFNVIGRWAFDGEYGLAYDRDDPFVQCRTLEPDDQLSCYKEFAQKLDSLSDWDIQKTARFTKDIEDDITAETVLGTGVASMMMREASSRNPDVGYNYLLQCRSIPERLYAACIRGIVAGFFEYGEPEREYEKAVPFCEDERLLPHERGYCYETMLEKFRRFYNVEKTSRLCKGYSPEFEEYCRTIGALQE